MGYSLSFLDLLLNYRHSRPQSLRSFWPVVGIESSGLVQNRKSAIHGLPVKSSKSDWLRMRNEYSAHAQKIGSGQSSRSQPQVRRIVGSGDENAGETKTAQMLQAHEHKNALKLSHYSYWRPYQLKYQLKRDLPDTQKVHLLADKTILCLFWQLTFQVSPGRITMVLI